MRFKVNITSPARAAGLLGEPKRHAREISRLSNFILIDIRALFIVISVYTTVAAVISTTAHNEATEDTTNDRRFNLTDKPEHTDVPVNEISNAILWDCREKSVTNQYYKALYGILFTAFGIVVLMFIGARLTVMCGWRSRLSHNLHNILWRLVLIKRLKQLVLRYGTNDPRTKKKSQIYYEQWNVEQKQKAHWTISAVPYFETVFLVIALPFMLTSYDIHPLGCVIGPDEGSIQYFNETGKVKLDFPPTLVAYQKFALVVSVVLMVPIVSFGLLLVWRYKMITKGMGKEVDKIAGKIEKAEDDDEDASGLVGGLRSKLGYAIAVAKTLTDDTMEGFNNAVQNEIPMEDINKTVNTQHYA